MKELPLQEGESFTCAAAIHFLMLVPIAMARDLLVVSKKMLVEEGDLSCHDVILQAAPERLCAPITH